MLETALLCLGCCFLSGILVYAVATLVASIRARRVRKEDLTPEYDKLKQAAEQGKKPKKAEFSKAMLLLNLALSLGLTVACVVVKVALDMDVSDLVTLTAAAYGVDGGWGGFYLWKSKNENRAKYAQQFVLMFADKYGVDAAIRIAEIVLKD